MEYELCWTEKLINYKYNPNDFNNYIFLAEDMMNYYNAVELYRSDMTVSNKLKAHKFLEYLHFTIKHRELDSGLSHDIAEELRDYIWGLLDG